MLVSAYWKRMDWMWRENICLNSFFVPRVKLSVLPIRMLSQSRRIDELFTAMITLNAWHIVVLLFVAPLCKVVAERSVAHWALILELTAMCSLVVVLPIPDEVELPATLALPLIGALVLFVVSFGRSKTRELETTFGAAEASNIAEPGKIFIHELMNLFSYLTCLLALVTDWNVFSHLSHWKIVVTCKKQKEFQFFQAKKLKNWPDQFLQKAHHPGRR